VGLVRWRALDCFPQRVSTVELKGDASWAWPDIPLLLQTAFVSNLKAATGTYRHGTHVTSHAPRRSRQGTKVPVHTSLFEQLKQLHVTALRYAGRGHRGHCTGCLPTLQLPPWRTSLPPKVCGPHATAHMSRHTRHIHKSLRIHTPRWREGPNSHCNNQQRRTDTQGTAHKRSGREAH
jgi:hypothetical protein